MRSAVIILAWLGVSCAAFAAQPRVVFDSPRGGEYYFVGQTQQVHVTTRIKSVVVELSRDGGVTFVTLGTIDNTVHDINSRGLMNWQVTGPESKICVIRVGDALGQFTLVSQQFRIGVAEGNGATPEGTITSTALATDSVTTPKLVDQAVESSKLADGSVTTIKLADGAVTTPKLADESVTAQKISSGPSSSQFLLAADGIGGASWVPPAAILVSPNFGNQPIVTTSSLTAGSVLTGNLNVSGSVTLPANSINAAALPANTTLQGNTFNGASQLVKLDNAGKLPSLDGSALTGVTTSVLSGQNAAYYLSRNNHTGTQLAATISDFDTQVRASRLDQMAQPTASVVLNNQKITGLANPTAAQDAATKSYVDTAAALPANTTLQGNTFNGASQLVKLDNAGKLPALDGSALTGIDPAVLSGQNAAYYLARANHTGTQLAATISDFDAQVQTSRLDQMAHPTGDVSLNSKKITNLADPSNPQEAATKNYVDGAGSTLNTAITGKVSKGGDSMSGTLLAAGNGVKIATQAGASDAGTVTKLEVLKSDNSTAFSVTANGDVTATTFIGPLTGTASNASQLNGQAAAYYLARANHTGTQLAATISDFDAQVQTSRLDQMAVPTASVDVNSQKIVNLLDPTQNQEAATKKYVDDAGSTLNTNKVSKTGDTMSGTLTAAGDTVKIAAKAGAGDAGTVTKLEVLKSDNSTAFKVTANGDVTGTSFTGPLTGTASNASQLNGQAASYYLSRANHTGTQLAATISDFDTQVQTSRLDQMAVPTASVDANSQKIVNLLDPTQNQDAATKKYVDDAGSTLNTNKVSKTGDTMSGTLTAAGDTVKIAAKAGAGDASTVTKLEVLKSDNSTAFKVTANGDVTATTFTGPLTGTASNASQLNGQAAAYYLARANHTGTQLAATISDFDTQVRTSRLDQMAVPNASVDVNSQKIVNLLDPTQNQDAATKVYVDSAGTTLNTAIGTKVSKAGDTMSGTLTAAGNGVKIAAQAGAGDAGTVKKLEVLKSDNSSAFSVTANGDVTAASFTGPLTGTASNAAQLNGQAASYYLSRANHTGTQLAATISDFDTQVQTSRLDQMANPTADVILNGKKITNLADPSALQDAATKNYVDNAGSTLNTSINGKVSKGGDSMSGTLLVSGNTVKIAAQAGAADAGNVTKLEVLKSDNSTAFNVTAGGDTNVGGVLTLQKAAIPAVVALSSSGTVATDASLGSVFTITLSGNVTLQAPSNPTSGQRCLWRFSQPASGGPFNVTLDTGVNGFRFGADIPSISLSTTANKVDYMGAIWNAADSKWDVIAFVQGY